MTAAAQVTVRTEKTWTLGEIEQVVRDAWSAETCDPVDLDEWRSSNAARGQCGVTALVLQELLGGDLLIAEVRHASGGRQGVHYWNRLAGRIEVDLTREQFNDGEVVGEPQAVVRPDGPPRRCREQYERLRANVIQTLGGRRP